MNNVIIYTDNEIEVDKEVSDIILNYLTTLGDWGGIHEGSLMEPDWSHSEDDEYKMCISLVERDALIANQELLGINVKLESKEVN
jgi:hypothetical protein